jgi:hypothetical protein
MERPMLKAIVKDDAIDGMLLQHPPTERNAILPHCDDGLRATLRHEKRLIPRLRWAGYNSGSIGHQKIWRGARPFVPTAQDGDPLPMGQQPLYKKNDKGSFPRSPDRQVSYAHHTTG